MTRPRHTWTPSDDKPPRWPYESSIWLEWACAFMGLAVVVLALAIWGVPK